MPAITDDTVLIRQALAYAIEVYRELDRPVFTRPGQAPPDRR